jgi:hypothetical protein
MRQRLTSRMARLPSMPTSRSFLNLESHEKRQETP